MEKRILVAFLLSIAVLYGSRVLLTPKAPPVPEGTAQTAQSPATPAPTPPPQVTPAAPTPAQGKAETPTEGKPQDIRADMAEDFAVDTTLYTATVSNRGAVLKGFKLKLYADDENKPIELIDAAGGAKLGWPLSFVTNDSKLDAELSNADFVTTREGNRLTMEFAANDLHARKTIAFSAENYELSIEATLTKEGKPVAHSIAWRGGFGDQSIIPPDPSKHLVVYPSGTSYKTTVVASLKDPQDMTVNRVGIEDQYFLAMMMMPDNGTVRILKQEYAGADGKPIVTSELRAPSNGQPMRIYVGPKDPGPLTKADADLIQVIDYGTYFGFIAKALTRALLWIHSYLPNFGWAIIVLTIAINFLLFPLRIKQQISMQKMSKIQPHMRTLQDQYKKLKPTDPKRAEIQTKMMGLYKEHGVNPMSGCLPLLLQMPLLYAIYTSLSVAIELRQAPWLWIHDLSRPEPYAIHILPLAMAIAMVVQQKMTPTTVDAAQARMMMIMMPVMMTFMFWTSASGLSLYWFTSTVVGIAQQVIVTKYWSSDTPSEKRAKAKAEITE